ncbi:MAG: hypothetical protein ABWY31_07225 [Pseudoxanthomonas sp.]
MFTAVFFGGALFAADLTAFLAGAFFAEAALLEPLAGPRVLPTDFSTAFLTVFFTTFLTAFLAAFLAALAGAFSADAFLAGAFLAAALDVLAGLRVAIAHDLRFCCVPIR